MHVQKCAANFAVEEAGVITLADLAPIFRTIEEREVVAWKVKQEVHRTVEREGRKGGKGENEYVPPYL